MNPQQKATVTARRIANTVPMADAGSGNSWQLFCQCIAKIVQPVEKQQKRVAYTLQSPESVFSSQKQPLTLFCSLLRGVWEKYEARRAEWTQGGPNPKGMDPLGPANGMARCAAIIVRKCAAEAIRRGGRLLQEGRNPVAVLALYAVLAIALSGPVVAQDDWGTSGAFDQKQGAQQRADAARAARQTAPLWSTGSPPNAWTALDAFERGKAGKPPPALSRFTLPSGPKIDQLFAVIAFAEAPRKGYDAIHGSATRLPSKLPTQMTLGEIKTWIKDTPGQHHAIGNFQIIPSTLLNLQRRLGLPDTARFDRATQNRMGALLVADAGYKDALSGALPLSDFMDNLARIWAGLPLASGKSAYHGYAGNRATVTRAFFSTQVIRIMGS